jgi:hypothetical protein
MCKTRSVVIVATLVSLLAVSMLGAAPAYATWYWTHGNNCQVQAPENAVYPGNSMGLGLDLFLKADLSSWVHCAPPTIGNPGKGVRFIKIDFNTKADATLDQVDIYNGAGMIKSVVLSFNNVHRTYKVDLGEKIIFNHGLGVSMLFSVGSSAALDERQIVVFGVGANFRNM